MSTSLEALESEVLRLPTVDRTRLLDQWSRAWMPTRLETLGGTLWRRDVTPRLNRELSKLYPSTR